MKFNKNQHGFAAIEIILVVVIIIAIGFIGLKMLKKPAVTKTTTVSSQTTLPTKIQSKADVSQSIKALDATPIGSKLDPSQLDSNISSLL